MTYPLINKISGALQFLAEHPTDVLLLLVGGCFTVLGDVATITAWGTFLRAALWTVPGAVFVIALLSGLMGGITWAMAGMLREFMAALVESADSSERTA